MHIDEYHMILAEVHELETMIASTPNHFVIDRLSLEGRKEMLEQELEQSRRLLDVNLERAATQL